MLDLKEFGELYLADENRSKIWSGLLAGISPERAIEFDIAGSLVESEEEAYEMVRKFVGQLPHILTKIYDHIWSCFSEFAEVSHRDLLSEWYSLAAVSIKDEFQTWLTLEPGDVFGKFSFFLRFTIVDDKITWSNIN